MGGTKSKHQYFIGRIREILETRQLDTSTHDLLSDLLHELTCGQYAPAAEVYQLLETGLIPTSFLRNVPKEQIRRWFFDLEVFPQANWLRIMRTEFPKVDDLGSCLGLSPRRIQQILRLTKIPDELQRRLADLRVTERTLRSTTWKVDWAPDARTTQTRPEG